MTDRDYALAMGEHPADVDRVLARLEAADDDAVPPGGAVRVPVSQEGDGS